MISLQNKTCLIDLDGTMYRGDTLIDGAVELINYLHHAGIPYYFITNNAMRTRKQNTDKMKALGFHYIKDYMFFTSAMAASRYLAHHDYSKRVFYIGQEGMAEALFEQGFVLDEKTAEVVLVGLDMTANYETYCQAYMLLQQGAALIGTNGDRRLPHGSSFRIGNGAIIEMLAYASEKTPIMIGKPHAPMMEEMLRYANITNEECVVIGDNLETDILFGKQHDVDTIFVTTGVHTRKDIPSLHIEPTIVIDHLKELIIT